MNSYSDFDCAPQASVAVEIPNTSLARSNVVALHSARSYVGDRTLGAAIGRSREKIVRWFLEQASLTKAEFLSMLDAMDLRLVSADEYEGRVRSGPEEIESLIREGNATLDRIEAGIVPLTPEVFRAMSALARIGIEAVSKSAQQP